MAETKKVPWTKVCETTEKDCGIPKATIQEVFNGVHTTISNIIKDEAKELKDNDVLSITTPIASYVCKNIPAHVEKDEKGKEWECSQAIGLHVAAPTQFLEIANSGFSCTRKALN
jgi:hypothetical protein